MLCGLAAKNDLHVFLLGGRPGSAELAATALKGAYPDLKCSTYCPPLGFEQSAAGLKETADAITAAQPDILFVAFGAPKQELLDLRAWSAALGTGMYRCWWLIRDRGRSRSSRPLVDPEYWL